jgi:glycosyltransferase involved in cell wall biosynthesis
LSKKILLVSRCAWTLYNFRAGQIRALLKRGYSVIGGGAGGDGYEEKISDLGIPFVSLPVDKKGTNLLSDLILFKTLFQWYRREKPDIVHHFTIKPVIYGSIAARLARVPRIINTITGLGYVFIEDLSWLKRLVEQQYRLALACAHFTFFQNPEDLEFFLKRKLIKSEKTGLLAGSGVDIEYFSPPEVRELNFGQKPCTFIIISRLLKEKGVYEFVEAARLVKGQFPETQFQLLGKRDERNPTVIPPQDIEAWRSEGLVTWLGETADVRPFLSRAEVVVLPSYREGLPRSLLEASAMGKPVITTDTVGCRDVVDPQINGLLVPVKDSRALAQAMIWMIEHPELRGKMGEAGRKKVEREFDEQTVIEKILACY